MPLGQTLWLRLPAAQAFLRLTARGSGDAAFFAATKAKGGGLVVTAKHDELQKQVWSTAGQWGWIHWHPCMAGSQRFSPTLEGCTAFDLQPYCLLSAQVGTQPGAYDAALLVGDSRSAQPVEWSLGEVKVRPCAAPAAAGCTHVVHWCKKWGPVAGCAVAGWCTAAHAFPPCCTSSGLHADSCTTMALCPQVLYAPQDDGSQPEAKPYRCGPARKQCREMSPRPCSGTSLPLPPCGQCFVLAGNAVPASAAA